MSTQAAQTTLCQQVAAAHATAQNSKAAAFTTYNFVQANYAAYLTSLVAADVALYNSISSAASAAGVNPAAVSNGPVPHGHSAKLGGF